MGFTHCYGILPFQGFSGDGWRFNGLYPLLWYFALSGLFRSMVGGSMGFTHCYDISPFRGFFGRWFAVQWA